MTKRLAGKVALVTGGGTGIGAAVALRFAAGGASVLVTGRRREPLELIAGRTGGLALVADVRDARAMAEVVRQAQGRLGGLDIVVANAGIGQEGDVAGLSEQAWQEALDINLGGAMRTVRAALPALRLRGAGAVVLVSSVAGLLGVPAAAAYCASKAALIGLMRSMAVDYGPFNIRVNALCPGWVKTPMSDAEMVTLARDKGISTPEAVRAVTGHLPLRRMAAPEEIAACAEFLASDDASFITGMVLVADGGGCAVDVGTLPFALT